MATMALRLALTAATTVLMARILQPEGRGIYVMITATATIAVGAGHLSFWRSQIAFWPDPARRPFLAGNGLICGLILGVVSALATYGIMTTFVTLPAPHLLVISLFAVPLGAAAFNLNGIVLLQSRTSLANRGVIVSVAVLCLPVTVLAAMGKLTITTAVVCWAISTSLPLALFLWSLGPSALRGDKILARNQLSLSGRYHIGLVAHHLLLTVDVYLLSTFHSTAEVGIYAVAPAFLALASVPTDSISQIALPRQAVQDEGDAKDATARALRLNLLLSSAFIGILTITSPLLIPLLYGDAFSGSVAPLLALAPGAIALSLFRPVEQYLIRLGRPMTMTAVIVAALLTNLLLNIVLIPRWGATGAALAATGSYFVLVMNLVAWFAKAARVGMRDILPQASDLYFLVTVVTATSSRFRDRARRA
jgi:O-antigen/teichoic acid export membrane protein